MLLNYGGKKLTGTVEVLTKALYQNYAVLTELDLG